METIEKSIEVNAPVERVYDQWTRFEEFPEFMEGVKQVTQVGERELHWIINLGGQRKEWNAEVVEQVPNKRIAWRSTSGSMNAGTIQFRAIDPARTVITVRMDYEPESTLEKLAAALGVVSGKVESDLRRFKEFIQRRTAQHPA